MQTPHACIEPSSSWSRWVCKKHSMTQFLSVPIMHNLSYKCIWHTCLGWGGGGNFHGLVACCRCSQERQKIIAPHGIWTTDLQNLNKRVFKCLPTQLQLGSSRHSWGLTKFYIFIVNQGFVHILLLSQNYRAKYELNVIPWSKCVQAPENDKKNYANYHHIHWLSLYCPQ